MIPRGEWRLRTVLMVLLVLATTGTLATLLAVGGGLYMGWLPQLRKDNVTQIRREAEQLAERMDVLLGSSQRELEVVGAALDQYPRHHRFADVLDALTAKGQHFEAVYVADRDGIVKAVSLSPDLGAHRDELLGTDLSANTLFRLAAQRKTAIWSDKFLSALSGGVTVGVAVPAGSLVLIGEISLHDLLGVLHKANKDSQLSVWLIDRRGELLVEDGPGEKLGPVNLLGLPIVQNALEQRPLPDTVTIRDETFHPAVAQFKIMDWFLLARMPAGLANPNIHFAAVLVAIALSSTLLIGGLLTPFAANWLSRPMHAITDRAGQIAGGTPAGDWPRGPVFELNEVAANLETMAKHMQERQDQFRAIFNASPVPMGLVDEAGAGVLIDANEAWIVQFGYRREETVGRAIRDLPLWATDAELAAVIRDKAHCHDRVEVQLQDAEKRSLSCEFARRPVVIGGRALAVWVIEDVTQRRQNQELIQRNNTMLQAVTRVQQRFLVDTDPKRAFEQILALLLEVTSSEYGFIGEARRQPDGQPYLKTHAITNIAWNDETRTFYEKNAPAGLEFYNLKTLFGAVLTNRGAVIANDPTHDPRRGGLPLGHPPLRAFLGLPFFHGDDLVGMVGLANRAEGYHEDLVNDLAPILATCSSLITAYASERARRDSEEALRTSEARLIEAQQVAQLGSWELDLENNQVYWTGEGCRLFGLDPAKAPFSRDLVESRFHPEDREMALEQMSRTIASNTPLDIEFRIVRPSGEVCWLHARGRTVHDPTGKPVRVVGAIQDVTARRDTEQALRESREQLDGILGSLDDVVWSAADDGSAMLYLNPAAERLYGRPVAEFFTRPNLWQEVVYPGDAAAVAATWKKFPRSGEIALEYRIMRPDGTVRWLRDRRRLVKDAAGCPLRIDGIATDITDRMQAELALRESEEKYRRLIETTGTGYVIVDDQGRVLDANPEYLRLTGRQELEDVLAHSVLEWTAPHDHARNAAEVARCVERGFVRNLEIDYLTPTGQVIPIEINATTLRDPNGLQVLTLCQDITQRKQAEAALRASLKEKTVLLQEVHHRVKNNLQVVSSLLNLQSRKVTDAETKRRFDDTANRVKSMALVHEQLYRSDSLSSIGLREYLRQLASNLAAAHQPLSMRVPLKVEADELFCGVESVIPLGLIINELVSNAYRHAYPADAAEGQILVRLTGLLGGRLRLVVEDGGRGLTANFDPNKEGSLGMQLVAMLAQQLGGEPHWQTSPQGASFTLEFKPEAPAQSQRLAS